MGISSTKTFNNNRPGLTEEGFALYRKYCALKAHFTGKFAYVKRGDAVGVKRSSFIQRSDAPIFSRVAKQGNDLEGLLIANFVRNPKFWIGDLEDETAYTIYNDWKRRTDQVEYYFKNDLENLSDDFTYVFRPNRSGDNPQVLEKVIDSEINFETFSILVRQLALNRAWKDKLADSYFAPKVIERAMKYGPLIRYDKSRLAGLVKSRWTDTTQKQ